MAKITFWKGTLAQYAAKKAANALDENRLYFIEEAGSADVPVNSIMVSGLPVAEANGLYVTSETDPENISGWTLSTNSEYSATIELNLGLRFATPEGDMVAMLRTPQEDSDYISMDTLLEAASNPENWSVETGDASAITLVKAEGGNINLLGSLYKGKTLIAPQRLGELTAGTTDEDKVPTAKAVADFVATFFAEGSAYEEAIKGITDRLDDAEGRLDTAEGDIDNLEGRMGTAEGDIDALEGRATTIEGKLTTAEGAITALDTNKANKADVYTKEEITNMLSSALEFKGTVNTVADLPETAETGDLYYVKEASKEYVYVATLKSDTHTGWEELGGVVDYSVFVQKTTKVNGKALSEDITLTGDDIKVGTFDTEGAVTTIGGETTLSGAIKALDEAISGVTGGSGGEGGSLASKMDKVSADAADQILTVSSTGNAAASGYKVGGETFGETAKANTVATEAAVMAALKATNDEVAGKMSLVASAVDGNIVAMDANGDSKNSGFSISSAETIADVANASATKLVNEKAVATAIANATIEWIEG